MDTNKFQEAIVKAENLVIAIPSNPTFDEVAGGSALYLSLESFGKKVNIFCPSPMLVEFNKLVGVDRVTKEVGDKNLTITLRDYPAQNIERVAYNINGGQMELTIIPKSQISAPNPNQVISTLGGMNADTVILVGVENQEELGEEIASELNKVPQQILILQNYRPGVLERRVGVLEMVDPNVSCISEAVGLLLLESNLPISEDTATNLLMGITYSTQNFTSNRVRPETFELSAKLSRIRSQAPTAPVVPLPEEEKPSENKAPEDWLAPKVYKGSTLP